MNAVHGHVRARVPYSSIVCAWACMCVRVCTRTLWEGEESMELLPSGAASPTLPCVVASTLCGKVQRL